MPRFSGIPVEETTGGGRFGGTPVDSPLTANPNLLRQGAAMEVVRSGAEFLSQRDPDIDYKTGIPSASFRANFSRMTNDQEKSQFLDKTVGKNRWGKDSFGAYFVKPEGLGALGIQSTKPVSIDEQSTTRYDIADFAGDAPAIGGAVLGGLLGGPLGVGPGMAMAAQGAMGGRGIGEIFKNLRGEQVNTGPGVATELAKEGVMAALGEGAVRALAPIGKFLLGPGAARMTPDKKALAESAMEQGFKIRPGSVTDAPILARWEGMVRNIFGDLYAPQNRAAAEAGVKRLTPSPGVASEAAGEAISRSVRQERVKFGAEMAGKYQAIDDMVGGQPLIPTAALKAKANEILTSLPKTAEGKTIGGKDAFVRDVLQMDSHITVSQAQRLRTMLREASDSPDLVPDISMHDARVLRGAVNDAFNQAKGRTEINDRAIIALRAADTAYAQGIRKFDNPIVTAITRDASRHGSVDPDMVVDYLIKPDRVVRLRRIKDIVPEAEWAKVKSAHAQDLLSTVMQGTDDPLKTIFNGRSFRDALDKYGRQTLEEVHGKRWVDDAYRYANSLMFAEKKTAMSGGIVAANVALHPVQNLPRLVWIRAMAKLVEQPGSFKYLTDGITLGPNTKAGAGALSRLTAQITALARDETGSASITVTQPQ